MLRVSGSSMTFQSCDGTICNLPAHVFILGAQARGKFSHPSAPLTGSLWCQMVTFRQARTDLWPSTGGGVDQCACRRGTKYFSLHEGCETQQARVQTSACVLWHGACLNTRKCEELLPPDRRLQRESDPAPLPQAPPPPFWMYESSQPIGHVTGVKVQLCYYRGCSGTTHQ